MDNNLKIFEKVQALLIEVFMIEQEPLKLLFDSQYRKNDFSSSHDKIPTFLGNFNLTEDDDTTWPPEKYLRMCLHIWDDDQNKREMIRFYNNGPT